ncbi:MAG: TauD/TfdA family dioxygenase [Reyranella sp.]|uniref:TauD/TfdA family dioxygenase n=1 Tax=Reyranella sp. TaxID=1929291 RepID=UPI001ACD90BE|nr:TauD/TfdA family dioxygenase [Reyranella sp.]MBN9087691.1 TauD/TfdA family dioxygenase [Reyranella sp.]
MHPTVLDRPITGCQAWTRADVREHDYRVVLSEAARRELIDAAATLRRQPVPLLALRADSLDLPACRAAMAEVRSILTDGRRFALLDRLPIEQLTLDEAKALYWILSSMLARPVAQKLDGTIVYDVHDTGRQALPGSGVRPDKTNIDLQFHNDNSYNFMMPEFVGLLCVRPAKDGGMSRVMSFATVHNALRERHREVLPRLYEPFWFDRQREYHPGEPETFSAPLFIRDGDRMKARMSLHQIRGGYALKGGGMDNETTAAVEAIREVFADTSLQFQFRLQAGEIQYVVNREIGHSRTEFHDFEEDERRRLLIRLWLRNEGAQGYIG